MKRKLSEESENNDSQPQKKQKISPKSASALLNFFYHGDYLGEVVENIEEKFLAKKPLFELLNKVYPNDVFQNLEIENDGIFRGEFDFNNIPDHFYQFINSESFRFKIMLQMALEKAFEANNEIENRNYFTEFGCQNIKEYFDFLGNLKDEERQSIISDDEFFKLEKIKESFADYAENPAFFENFLKAFHQTRAEFSFALQDHSTAEFDKIKDFIDTKDPHENIIHKKYRERHQYVNQAILRDRFKKDHEEEFEFCGISAKAATSIGVSRNHNEDSHIAGKIDHITANKSAALFLKETFQELGKEFLQICDNKSINQGSTAVATIYSPDGFLTAANAGDSCAVLFMLRDDNGITKVDYKKLTTDHTPKDFFEKALINSKGGTVENNRINGNGINISRGFGDSRFKGQNQQCLTSYEPEITQENINILRQNYKEILLQQCCDGFYETNFNEACYAKAIEYFFNNPEIATKWQGNLNNYLRDCAILSGVLDNTSSFLIHLSNNPEFSLFYAVLDGHGIVENYFGISSPANEVSNSASREFQKILSPEQQIIYPKNAQSILDRADSDVSTVIDEKDIAYYEESEEEESVEKSKKSPHSGEYSPPCAQADNIEDQFKSLYPENRIPSPLTSIQNASPFDQNKKHPTKNNGQSPF